MNNQHAHIHELLLKIEKMRKQLKLKPSTLRVSDDGRILIDPNNKEQREWYENDEEYEFDL